MSTTTRIISNDGVASTEQWQLWDLSSFNNRPGKLPTARADAWEPPSEMALPVELCQEIRTFALANGKPYRHVGGDVYPLAHIPAEDGTRYYPDRVRWPSLDLPQDLIDACVSRMVEANLRWWTLDVRAWWIVAKRYIAGQDSYHLVEHPTHTDWAPRSQSTRLTSSVQLSAPDEYDGGQLSLTTELGDFPLRRTQGTFVVFPSWAQHSVTEVTRGERWALLINAFGPRIR